MEEDDTRHDSSFNDHIANEKKGIHLIEWLPFFVHHNRLLSNLKTLMERVFGFCPTGSTSKVDFTSWMNL